MAKKGEEQGSKAREILKKELEGKGYILRLSTERVEGNIMGRMEVINAETDKTVAKLLSLGRIDDLEWSFGFYLSEDILKDLVTQAISTMDALRSLLPGISISEG